MDGTGKRAGARQRFGRDEGNEEGRPHDPERWGKLGGPTRKNWEGVVTISLARVADFRT